MAENGRYSGVQGYVCGLVWARFKQGLRVSAAGVASAARGVVCS